MPRVPVEKLRALFGGDAVKAKTPLQKQVCQYGMAVCEALTNGMDERALTKAAALSSAQVPWLSNGASIVSTMPLRGRDAGRNAEAIRKKQRDERNYADMKGIGMSGFMESAAYKAWVGKATTLRENVMGLYTKLVQLEQSQTPRRGPPAGPRLQSERTRGAVSLDFPAQRPDAECGLVGLTGAIIDSTLGYGSARCPQARRCPGAQAPCTRCEGGGLDGGGTPSHPPRRLAQGAAPSGF
jgi:hypothetical protein